MDHHTRDHKSRMNEIDLSVMQIFDFKRRLGKGAYGVVWKAIDKRNQTVVAIKKIFDAFRDETDAQRTFREIIFLKAFNDHPNIIKMLGVFRAGNNMDIYLSFEYMESDLHNIIKKGAILKDVHKRYIMYQIINAIKYIHSANVIHRDLKPSNILLDSRCRCKLADFGLARSLIVLNNRDHSDMMPNNILTDYVATRWYRAPEILLSSKSYTKGIDMWSIGCILAEMIRGRPLFQGSSTLDQIEKILAALPSPTEEDVKSFGLNFGTKLLKEEFNKRGRETLIDMIKCGPRDAIDLVKALLVLDPKKRITADEAITFSYMKRFRDSEREVDRMGNVIPPFRDDIRFSINEYRTKLYDMLINGENEPEKTRTGKKKTGKKSGNVTASKSRLQGSVAKISNKRTSLNTTQRLEPRSSISIFRTPHSKPSTSTVYTLEKRLSSMGPVSKITVEKDELIKTTQLVIDPEYLANAKFTPSKEFQPDQNNLLPHGLVSIKSIFGNGGNKKNTDQRHSIDGGYSSLSNGTGRVNSRQSYESDIITERFKEVADDMIAKERQEFLEQQRCRSNPMAPTSSNNITANTRGSSSQTCYDRRLKQLEREIAQYKAEVKAYVRKNKSEETKETKDGKTRSKDRVRRQISDDDDPPPRQVTSKEVDDLVEGLKELQKTRQKLMLETTVFHNQGCMKQDDYANSGEVRVGIDQNCVENRSIEEHGEQRYLRTQHSYEEQRPVRERYIFKKQRSFEDQRPSEEQIRAREKRRQEDLQHQLDERYRFELQWQKQDQHQNELRQKWLTQKFEEEKERYNDIQNREDDKTKRGEYERRGEENISFVEEINKRLEENKKFMEQKHIRDEEYNRYLDKQDALLHKDLQRHQKEQQRDREECLRLAKGYKTDFQCFQEKIIKKQQESNSLFRRQHNFQLGLDEVVNREAQRAQELKRLEEQLRLKQERDMEQKRVRMLESKNIQNKQQPLHRLQRNQHLMGSYDKLPTNFNTLRPTTALANVRLPKAMLTNLPPTSDLSIPTHGIKKTSKIQKPLGGGGRGPGDSVHISCVPKNKTPFTITNKLPAKSLYFKSHDQTNKQNQRPNKTGGYGGGGDYYKYT